MRLITLVGLSDSIIIITFASLAAASIGFLSSDQVGAISNDLAIPVLSQNVAYALIALEQRPLSAHSAAANAARLRTHAGGVARGRIHADAGAVPAQAF